MDYSYQMPKATNEMTDNHGEISDETKEELTRHRRKDGILCGMIAGVRSSIKQSLYDRTLIEARKRFNNIFSEISFGRIDLEAMKRDNNAHRSADASLGPQTIMNLHRLIDKRKLAAKGLNFHKPGEKYYGLLLGMIDNINEDIKKLLLL